MSKRISVVFTDAEHSDLVSRAKYLDQSMSQLVCSAVRAIVYGNVSVVGDRIMIRQADGQEQMFQLQRLTPTNVSRETPVPDAPEDTTEYKVNPLVKPDAPDRFRTNDDGVSFDYMYIPEKPISGGKK